MAAPTLRSSTVQTINDNIIDATLVPELFGPALYVHSETVPLPTSLVDGYPYNRSECFYLWSLNDTGPASEIRLSVFAPSINPTTGVVTINTWRMRPGGPIQLFHDGSLRVITVAVRQGSVSIPSPVGASPPSDLATLGADFGPYDISIPFAGAMTIANQDLTPPFVIPRPINFPAAAVTQSTAIARVGPTSNTQISIRKNNVEFLTLLYRPGFLTGTFGNSGITFGGHLSNLAPETITTFDGLTDVFSIVGPATPDPTLADLGIVLAAKRAF